MLLVLVRDGLGLAVRGSGQAELIRDLALPVINLFDGVGINLLQRDASVSGVTLHRILLAVEFGVVMHAVGLHVEVIARGLVNHGAARVA